MRNLHSETLIEFPLTASQEPEEVRFDHRNAFSQIQIGRLVDLQDGKPKVEFPNCPLEGGVYARTGIPLTSEKIGREVILAFVEGNPALPVVLGLILDLENQAPVPSALDVHVDGERLTVNAKSEIVLRCGEASITLTAAGKVLLKGTYVLSRSSGYNKIKGAAVDIN